MYKESLELAKQIRGEWGKLDVLRDEGLQFPEDVTRIENVSYGNYGTDSLLDIYIKKSGNTGITIVNIHGGGWVYSNKELYKHYCLSLADRGFTVINFNYRLAPEHPYPAAVQDVNQVFSWLLDHADEYGIDMEKLAVVGDSAGAQIGAQYLAMWSNQDYARLCGIAIPEKLKIKACVFNSGVYDILHADLGDTQGVVNAYLAEAPQSYEKEMDILGNITTGFPPAFVMTAYYDFARPYAKPFADRLKENGVLCKLKEYGSKETKEIGHVFHCDLKIPLAKVCNDEECEFLKEIVKFLNFS